MVTYDFTQFLKRALERVARSRRDGRYAREEHLDRADLYGSAAAIGILTACEGLPRGADAADLAVGVRR